MHNCKVTPCMGVWIEIREDFAKRLGLKVTPCMGVWIEISELTQSELERMSLPAWECGLKFLLQI